jgi:DNA polymerase (family X)
MAHDLLRSPSVVLAAPTNEEIAETLDQVGELLAAQEAKPFRALAYHRAADMLRETRIPVRELATAGAAGLVRLPGIGESLARSILEMLRTGRLGLLETLRGQADPESLLRTVPGIGRGLARRIHEELGIETLEELEIAAHDGRLAALAGFGRRRVRGIVEALAGRLGRRRSASVTPPVSPVADLLAIDREYREKASAGVLQRIAPRRFNPEGRAWLPILHTEVGSKAYTALFSNTARAHELGKTGDWVVIYRDDGSDERQATVVTEGRGPLAGHRVVRGQEAECARYYASFPEGRSRSSRRSE